MLVSVKQLKKETNQFNNSGLTVSLDKLTISPEDSVIKNIDTPLLKVITKGNIIETDVNLTKRKEMITAKSFEPVEFAYGRAIGKNDSLYSNFTELIALTKRKVGRIVIIEDGKRMGYGTGFMVSKNLLLTNWHVFRDESMASDSEVHFFYEYDAHGRPITPTIFKFDTKTFFRSNQELDYCFVAVNSSDISGKVSLESIGYLFLDKGLGKIGDINVERLNIIHHPLGDYKQISIRENLFTDINDTKIFYETDTAQGSSGSPIFNDQWQVVGLHHKSIAKMTKDELNYLDKNNKIIPVIDGKIDASRIVWLKNEGMRISVVLKHLLGQNPGNSIVDSINIQPVPEMIYFTVNNNDNNLVESKNNPTITNDKNITINIPVSALNNEKSIDISLNSSTIGSVNPNISNNTTFQKTAMDELLLEIAKIDKENAKDFSKCEGYDPYFLGKKINMPQPRKSIEKEIAQLKDKSNELKYFKYSVIFNAVRKMPIISAVNAEGDAAKRLDNSKRKDDWLRDKRIDIEAQLTDKFYSKSNFDKGHMSRFEDANWDTTEEKAYVNGIYTCFYTNACPQVPGINRMGDNLWGKLEKAVLEKGIKKEVGKQAKMTVFNGPIFDENKDRIRMGVTVPMQFYKIILWLNGKNKLKATAFKLSQELLVTDDQFLESMILGDEALDIHKLVTFKRYQCSIKSLGILTNIDFSHLEKYDTFKSIAGSKEILLVNEKEISI